MDFMPKNRRGLYLWYKNLRDKIPTEGPKFGVPPEQITAVQNLAQAAMDFMEATDAALAVLRGRRKAEVEGLRGLDKEVRRLIRYWKTLPGFATSGSAGALRIQGTPKVFDPGKCKPTLKVMIAGGKVILKFRKNGADAVNLYTRLAGEFHWTKLARDSSSPCMDPRPLATPNVPEVREYMAMAEHKDVEVGLPSTIVSVVYAG